jgi:hypothetical protein
MSAVAVAATLAALALAGATYLSPLAPIWENAPSPAQMLPPTILALFITVVALIYPVSRSTLGRARLIAAILLASIGIGVILTNVEAMFFLDLERGQLTSGILAALTQAVVITLSAVLLFSRRVSSDCAPADPSSHFSAGGWIGRVAVCAVSYTVLYMVAGILILPYVRSFYETQEMIAVEWLLPLQLVRGSFYVLFALPLIRSMRGSRWQVALATAVLFPVLGGAPSLLVPNPLMPDFIRPYHIIEITWSNFAYGLLVGWLFWNRALNVVHELSGATRKLAGSNVSIGSI